MHRRFNRFDNLYDSVMNDIINEDILLEDALDVMNKTVEISNGIKVAIGNMLQAPQPNVMVPIGLYLIGKTGQSGKLFAFIGKRVMKELSTLGRCG